MSNLGVEQPALVVMSMWRHCLYSLFMGHSPGETTMVVTIPELVKFIEANAAGICQSKAILTDPQEINRNGDAIAKACSEEFTKHRYHATRGWTVTYMTEYRCFDGVRSSRANFSSL